MDHRVLLLLLASMGLFADRVAAAQVADKTRQIDAIQIGCGLKIGTITASGDRIQLQPFPAQDNEKVDCALEKLKTVGLGNPGFVGNEAEPNATVQQPRITNAIPVEVSTGGDDGLTQRLADVVRNAFSQSDRFTSAPLYTPHVLRVTIMGHVGWENVNGRTRVTYKAMFESDRGGERKDGACWEDDLGLCAREIVENAIKVAPR